MSVSACGFVSELPSPVNSSLEGWNRACRPRGVRVQEPQGVGETMNRIRPPTGTTGRCAPGRTGQRFAAALRVTRQRLTERRVITRTVLRYSEDMADLLRMLTLDGQVVGAGMLVALVWLVITVKGLDTKVTALDAKVTGIANTVADLVARVAGLDTRVTALEVQVGSSHAAPRRGSARPSGRRHGGGVMTTRKPMKGRRTPGSAPPRTAARTVPSGSTNEPPRMTKSASAARSPVSSISS